MAIDFVSFEDDQAEARLIVYEVNSILKDLAIHRDDPGKVIPLMSRRDELLDRHREVRLRQLAWDSRFLECASS